jgi:NADPH:quinone reductase-like Zn-dependent oxidoreductase
MKAYYSTAYGRSEVSVYGDLPDPVAGPRQLLVEIKAVSINPVDWKIRRGDARLVTGFRFPRVFGADFAGIVRETGSSVTSFGQDDRVYGSRSILFDRKGALAELRAVRAQWDICINLVHPSTIPVDGTYPDTLQQKAHTGKHKISS